jgi:uncharacterized membrane protein
MLQLIVWFVSAIIGGLIGSLIALCFINHSGPIKVIKIFYEGIFK